MVGLPVVDPLVEDHPCEEDHSVEVLMEEVSSSVGRLVAGRWAEVPGVVAHLEEVRLAEGQSVEDLPSLEAVH